jgi:hypothetical protein
MEQVRERLAVARQPALAVKESREALARGRLREHGPVARGFDLALGKVGHARQESPQLVVVQVQGGPPWHGLRH